MSAALIGISAEFLERGKRLSLNQKNYRKSIAVILARRGNHFSFSLGEKAGMRTAFFPRTILTFMGEGKKASQSRNYSIAKN